MRWGTPKEKGQGCWSELSKRSPKRYQDSVLWAWLEVFSPLRGTNSKTTRNLLSIFFGSSSRYGPFVTVHPKRHQNPLKRTTSTRVILIPAPHAHVGAKVPASAKSSCEAARLFPAGSLCSLLARVTQR